MRQKWKSGVVWKVGMPEKDDEQATHNAGSLQFYFSTGKKKTVFTSKLNGVTAYHLIA